MSNPKGPPARVGKALSSILSSPRVAREPAMIEAFPEASPADTPATVGQDPASSVPETPTSQEGRPAARPRPEPTSNPGVLPNVLDDSAPGSNNVGTVATMPARHLTLEPSPERLPERLPAPSDEPRPASVADVPLAEQGGTRKRETFLISAALADEMRDAIVHLQGPPRFLSLASFGEEAIRAYLDVLKAEHSGGKPFPKRPHAVRQGRPLR